MYIFSLYHLYNHIIDITCDIITSLTFDTNNTFCLLFLCKANLLVYFMYFEYFIYSFILFIVSC